MQNTVPGLDSEIWEMMVGRPNVGDWDHLQRFKLSLNMDPIAQANEGLYVQPARVYGRRRAGRRRPGCLVYSMSPDRLRLPERAGSCRAGRDLRSDHSRRRLSQCFAGGRAELHRPAAHGSLSPPSENVFRRPEPGQPAEPEAVRRGPAVRDGAAAVR